MCINFIFFYINFGIVILKMEKYHPPCVSSEVVTEFSKPQVSVFMRTASLLRDSV